MRRNEKDNVDELSVFITFHVFNDSSMNIIENNIHETIKELFNKTSKVLTRSQNDNGYEIIYKINKPLMHNDKENEEFFKKLQNLFDNTSESLPHFTQVNEKDLEEAMNTRNKKEVVR